MELISKKELLATTGISYGQLYRWKREGLIPEDWFIKQSAFTGQETFFPRAEILARVQAILDMKDSHSLEELASLLAADETREIFLDSLGEIDDPDGALEAASDALRSAFGKPAYPLAEVAMAFGLVSSLRKADFSLSDALVRAPGDSRGTDAIVASIAVVALKQSAPILTGLRPSDMLCTVIAIGDGFHVCFSKGTEHPVFDAAVRVLARLPLGETVNTLKSRLAGKGIEPTKFQGDK